MMHTRLEGLVDPAKHDQVIWLIDEAPVFGRQCPPTQNTAIKSLANELASYRCACVVTR